MIHSLAVSEELNYIQTSLSNILYSSWLGYFLGLCSQGQAESFSCEFS